jgi:hypothetical protein
MDFEFIAEYLQEAPDQNLSPTVLSHINSAAFNLSNEQDRVSQAYQGVLILKAVLATQIDEATWEYHWAALTLQDVLANRSVKATWEKLKGNRHFKLPSHREFFKQVRIKYFELRLHNSFDLGHFVSI